LSSIPRKVLAVPLLVIAALLALPVLINSEVFEPLCRLDAASAQDNPCLNQEATISALALENLRLRATGSVLERHNLEIQLTLEAQQTEIVEVATAAAQPVLVTFEVIITATPEPDTAAQIVPTASPTPSPTPEPEVEETEEVDEVEPELSPTPAATDIPAGPPTLPPTVEGSQMQIVEIIRPGDLNNEVIRLRNDGGTLDMTGWTLTDHRGNVFTFPDEQRLFARAGIGIATRSGQDTATTFFWGLDSAIFNQPEAAVILRDGQGDVQAVLRP
jgi:hypothetical protein